MFPFVIKAYAKFKTRKRISQACHSGCARNHTCHHNVVNFNGILEISQIYEHPGIYGLKSRPACARAHSRFSHTLLEKAQHNANRRNLSGERTC